MTAAPSAAPDASLVELLAEVRRIDVQARRLVTEAMAGGYHSVFRGAGVEFEEVREYVEGDDPRTIDWNVTARVGRPFVKKYAEERELSVYFLLDLSRSMEAGFSGWSSRAAAVRVVACLALSATRNGDKTGLLAFGERVERFVPATKGLQHALRILRDGLALPAARGETNLAAALERASRAIRKRAILFVVSDFLGQGYEHALTLCARRHEVVAVRLLPPEIDAPPRELLAVVDPESGREGLLDLADESVRAAYAQRVAAWRARTDDALRAARVDWMDVAVPPRPSPDAIAGPILRFFRMRERRGEKR